MSIKDKSLNILVPMYGGMGTVNVFESFTRLILMLMHHGVKFSYTFTYNESLITRGRNRLVDEYLKNHEETHALFVDADIGFQAEDVLAMLELDLDIIAAPCAKKSINWGRIERTIRKNGRAFTPDEMSRISADFVFNYEPFVGRREIKLDELQEMRCMGTGLMMIRRNVFAKFREAYPDRWYESRSDPNALPGPIHDFFRVGVNPDTHEYDSEDYFFCTDAKAIGFKVWMIPWMRTSHMGTYKFIADMPAVAALSGDL
jgi:hypothetical protein